MKETSNQDNANRMPLKRRNRSEKYINREISWLQFNQRVLEEAMNPEHPLLERLRFLSISASNLDEFYMVRVAGLKDQLKHNVATNSQDGMTPAQQLRAINLTSRELMSEQQRTWLSLQKALHKEGIEIIRPKSRLSQKDKTWAKTYFLNNIFPALTPFAVDNAHPFPFLPNLGMAIVLQLARKNNVTVITKTSEHETKLNIHSNQKKFQAVIPLPQKLPRFIKFPERGGKARFMMLEDLIRLFQEDLFPGFEVAGEGIIRITRDSELETSEEAEDLMRYFESAVKRRRRGEAIRVKINKTMPESLREFVMDELAVAQEDVIAVEGILGLSTVSELLDCDRPDLLFPPMHIRFPERIRDFGGDCFAAIKAKDIVIHHPYESFDVVVQFLRQAAADPDIIAIKQTLYRTSNDSPIVEALIEAAEAGKSVTAMVELKARFDEEANIRWARNLERAGAQVVFGIPGLKTHAKVSLVVRQSEEGLESYVHFGTGNYHPITAKVYSDLSFFTCKKALCRDAHHLFNYLTGYAPPEKYEKISVAPLYLRNRLLEFIQSEIDHAEAGRPAHIWLKMNSLVDPEMIDALYEASQAGVKVDLIIRGICCLRPGVVGMSENIRVKSIVGRFLEHARIFCFGNGNALPHNKATVFISSADWMPRNLNGRVEIMVPVENPTVHEQVMGQIMDANIRDEKQSWELQADGSYQRAKATKSSFSAHDYFINNPSLSGRGKALRN